MRSNINAYRILESYRQLSNCQRSYSGLLCRYRTFSSSVPAQKKKGVNKYVQQLKAKQLKLAKREAASLEESTASVEDDAESRVADHREIGTAYNLFTTSSYSPGSPLFHPNGAHIFNKLISFLRAQYPQFGIEEVITPTIYKQSLWKKSGHWDAYADAMYQVHGRSVNDEASTVSGNEMTNGKLKSETTDHTHNGEHDCEADESVYGLKPMNCPGHCLLYSSVRRSYRDLPIRYADFSTLHRNEASGSLTGLTRLRRFHQDDGHIFCRPSQVQAEIARTLAFVQMTYKKLGMGKYKLVLSTRPETGDGECLGDGFIGSVEAWNQAEGQLREVLEASGQKWTIAPGEAAFYGPKIDIVLEDTAGKSYQTATIQLDFQLPRRFGLTYATTPKAQLRDRMLNFHTDNHENDNASSADKDSDTVADPDDKNKNHDNTDRPTTPNQATPVLIHRAVLGSVERFLALLLERYNGTFPFWLSPRPVILLSVSQGSATLAYIRKLAAQLSGYNLVSPHSTSSLSLTPPLTPSSAKSRAALKKAKSSNTQSHLSPHQKHSNDPRDSKDPEDPEDPEPDSPEDILLLSKPAAQSLLHARAPVRVDVDISAVTLGRKIKLAKKQGYNHILVVGPKDAEAGTVQVEIWNQAVRRDMQGRLMAQDQHERRGFDGLKDLEKVQGWLAEAAAAAAGDGGVSKVGGGGGGGGGAGSSSKGEILRDIKRGGHVRVQSGALRLYFERLIDEYM